MSVDERRRLDELRQRLDHGWSVIDGESDRSRREKLTDFWLKLLGQYQDLRDTVRRRTGE